MSSRDLQAFRLEHILEQISRLENVLQDVGPESFSTNWVIVAAVTRCIEIISEASRHISAELRATEPEIPWPKIAATGNILRHVYEKVDDDVIYRIATESVVDLEPAVLRMMKRLEP